MELQLANKRVLVTGSSAGIGKAIAERLAEEGASVVVTGRDKKKTETVAQKIRAETKLQISSPIQADDLADPPTSPTWSL